MKRFTMVFAIALLVAALGAIPVFAQSSGNFSASATAATCAIGAGGSFSGGTGITELDTDISTSSGSGVTLDIRPSLVTGLFTDTKINNQISSSSADIGIQVCVTVDDSGTGILPTNCAVYDQRFQQISSSLFSVITTCGASAACTVNTDCVTGDTCYNPTGAAGAGTCIGPPTTIGCTTTGDCTTAGLLTDICDNPTGGLNAGFCAPTAAASCNFELILSTLSAHSFDFVIPVSKGKPHHVKVTWKTIGAGAGSGASVASCVGPGIVTVTQYKVFNNSGALLSF